MPAGFERLRIVYSDERKVSQRGLYISTVESRNANHSCLLAIDLFSSIELVAFFAVDLFSRYRFVNKHT